MPIRVLPVHLVNKIAAGEVIERPASVVKELVENSLDAGATRVDVTIEDGGRKLISISDNGCGMDESDLSLTFVPHATSKLAEEDDLFRISTMGFRGEAMASIASISHAHVRTRLRDNPDASGYEIEASGEHVGEVRPCAASAGTSTTIRDIFFNTPARRKFMRTANTESGHIAEQLTRLALPQPQIAFTLTHNGRKVQNLPACQSTRQRITDIFGTDLADSLLVIPERTGAVSVSGLVGTPSAARSSGKWQYFFLNGRFIRDRLLAHALKEAFRGLIDPRKFPVAFIFITIDPGDVDVNVHPTKVEVRFRDSQAVHGQVLAALRDAINKSDLNPTATLDTEDITASTETIEQASEARRDSVRKAIADFFKATPAPQPRLSFNEPQVTRQASAPVIEEDDEPVSTLPLSKPQAPLAADTTTPTTTPQVDASDLQCASQQTAGEAAPQAAPSVQDREFHLRSAPATNGHALFQVNNSYIVAQCDDGLIIVDQHALHERIIYNELQARLSEGNLTAQRMLIPATITVTAGESDLLMNNTDLLEKLSIEIEPFGPNTLAIQQFPLLLTQRGVDAADFIRKVIDQLQEDETTDSERIIESILQTMSCKAAIKAGDPLTVDEMQSLLAKRPNTVKASSCPHGRPTTLQLTLKDLEKQFKRV